MGRRFLLDVSLFHLSLALSRHWDWQGLSFLLLRRFLFVYPSVGWSFASRAAATSWGRVSNGRFYSFILFVFVCVWTLLDCFSSPRFRIAFAFWSGLGSSGRFDGTFLLVCPSVQLSLSSFAFGLGRFDGCFYSFICTPFPFVRLGMVSPHPAHLAIFSRVGSRWVFCSFHAPFPCAFPFIYRARCSGAPRLSGPRASSLSRRPPRPRSSACAWPPTVFSDSLFYAFISFNLSIYLSRVRVFLLFLLHLSFHRAVLVHLSREIGVRLCQLGRLELLRGILCRSSVDLCLSPPSFFPLSLSVIRLGPS